MANLLAGRPAILFPFSLKSGPGLSPSARTLPFNSDQSIERLATSSSSTSTLPKIKIEIRENEILVVVCSMKGRALELEP